MKPRRTYACATRARRGFTLIEMMAVVVLAALLLSVALPDFGAISRANLRSQSKLLGATIELARQRAVVTGKPHRLVVDLDAAAYHLEWRMEATPEPALDAPLSYEDRRALLVAPPAPEWSFEPIPVLAGSLTALQEPLYFAGVDTPAGWIDSGTVYVHFEDDGTADPSTIVMSDDVENRKTLEILPLAEAVRIRDES